MWVVYQITFFKRNRVNECKMEIGYIYLFIYFGENILLFDFYDFIFGINRNVFYGKTFPIRK